MGPTPPGTGVIAAAQKHHHNELPIMLQNSMAAYECHQSCLRKDHLSKRSDDMMSYRTKIAWLGSDFGSGGSSQDCEEADLPLG